MNFLIPFFAVTAMLSALVSASLKCAYWFLSVSDYSQPFTNAFIICLVLAYALSYFNKGTK